MKKLLSAALIGWVYLPQKTIIRVPRDVTYIPSACFFKLNVMVIGVPAPPAWVMVIPSFVKRLLKSLMVSPTLPLAFIDWKP